MAGAFREPVILIEEDEHGIMHPRGVVLERPHILQILTKMPLSATQTITKLFVNRNGERDGTRQCRVFREVKAPIREESERPLYDELHVKLTDEVDKPTTR